MIFENPKLWFLYITLLCYVVWNNANISRFSGEEISWHFLISPGVLSTLIKGLTCQKNGFIKITFKSVGDTINGHFRWRMEDEDFFSAILHLWEAGLQKENMLKLYLWMFPNKWLAINEFKFCWKHHLKDEKISMHFENDNHQKYWCGRPLKAIPWFF